MWRRWVKRAGDAADERRHPLTDGDEGHERSLLFGNIKGAIGIGAHHRQIAVTVPALEIAAQRGVMIGAGREEMIGGRSGDGGAAGGHKHRTGGIEADHPGLGGKGTETGAGGAHRQKMRAPGGETQSGNGVAILIGGKLGGHGGRRSCGGNERGRPVCLIGR